MYRKKECVAMLLAGGQGSRLYVLTQNVAKPAVPFGGKYRIIDFPLSNCINSGIDTVGVLTQYEPHELNAYIGNGQPWDLDRLTGGVYILPPYQRGKGSEWYKGTANAIYQNIGFVEQFDPEYVLVLSGDHIYKMDYSAMLDSHKKKNADCTIAVIDVSVEEAPRFGIMNCRGDEDEIYEFEEKPKQPKSTLASMGIYIFTWKKLRAYLERDNENKKSANDFGKNIIPAMLANGERMFAYRFEGYWKDVGTIESLWEANMDMLSQSSGLNLDDTDWRIYARNTGSPPTYLSPDAHVAHSVCAEGCELYGDIEQSVLFPDVVVKKGAKVKYSILMPGTVVEENASVEYAIVAEKAVIGKSAHVGAGPADTPSEEWGVAVVAGGVKIARNAVLKAGEMADAASDAAEK